MSSLPSIDRPLELLAELETVRNELRWRVRLGDGSIALLGQLLPELAFDESLRRRYVYEAERLATIDCPRLAKTISIGPLPDPKLVEGIAPWRLAEELEGENLDQWLQRAPVPLEEGISLLTALAQAVGELHQAGLVLRDLEPRNIVIGNGQYIRIKEVGMARMDILSSRTASSLMLESSCYAAPEHLRSTLVDARADVYTIAAIAWQALTGVLPYDEESPFLRDYTSLPKLESLRDGIPCGLTSLLHACLSESPDSRPRDMETIVDVLQGNVEHKEYSLERISCQACGNDLRLGMRLCLYCGKESVQFLRAKEGDDSFTLVLRAAKDNQQFYSKLRQFFLDVGEGQIPKLNFITGSLGMYSKREVKSLIKLPASLMGGLEKESANALAKKLKADGFKVKVKKGKLSSQKNRSTVALMILGGGIGLSMAIPSLIFGNLGVALLGGAVGGIIYGIGFLKRPKKGQRHKTSLSRLRKVPLALPASDPYVLKLAELLTLNLSLDVREQVSDLALLVQRLYRHKNEASNQKSSIEMLTEPLSKLVDLIVDDIKAISAIDLELSTMDEGHLIRAIAASSEREEESHHRQDFLTGLDKLRALEDQRSLRMMDLLGASSLLERTVKLGLSETDSSLLQSNRITMGLATLGSDGKG